MSFSLAPLIGGGITASGGMAMGHSVSNHY